MEDQPTAKIELAMEDAARLVEEAFLIAHAQAVGAFFDALVDDGIAEGEGAKAICRAKRVMLQTLHRLKTARYAFPDDVTKVYVDTPAPR